MLHQSTILNLKASDLGYVPQRTPTMALLPTLIWEMSSFACPIWTTSPRRTKSFPLNNVCPLLSAKDSAAEVSEEKSGDLARFGRREALVSFLTQASVPFVFPAVAEEAHRRNRHIEAGVVVEDTFRPAPPLAPHLKRLGFVEEVGNREGITSPYVRPGAPSPLLPLDGLLQTDAYGKSKSAAPSQIYISVHGPNQMQVSWITWAAPGASVVEYGLSPKSYTAQASGMSSSYVYEDYTSGFIHFVVIGPLKDNTVYYYRVGGGGQELSFKTPPPAGPDVPITFVVVGDLGQTSNTVSTLQHIAGCEYDMLILPGDLSYADGEQRRWDSYGQLVSPLASKRPWMVTQGNHEIESAPRVEDFRAYNARWKMPYTLSGSNSNLFYSFEVAGVHFLMLGSYADFSRSSDQYKWLKKDLATVDRSKTPWLIGVLHAPWYNSNFAHQGEGNGMLAAMEDLLFDANVDIVFAGHVHAYERSVRTYKGKPNNRGILYLNIGDGGNREGLAPLYFPQPRWSAYRESSYGHGELQILDRTTALWTWHRNQDDEAVVADRVSITSLSSDPLQEDEWSKSVRQLAAPAGSRLKKF